MNEGEKPEIVKKVHEELAKIVLPPANSTADEALRKYGNKFELDAIRSAIRPERC